MDGKNVKMSGSCVLPSGEYNELNFSGSAKLLGEIKCASLSACGSIKCEGTVDAGTVNTSGSASFLADVKADKLDISGSFKTAGAVSCKDISTAGSVKVSGDISAHNKATLHGKVVCGGTLSSDSLDIRSSSNTEICSVNAGKIIMRPERTVRLFKRVSKVTSSIVGDDILLEYVRCPLVCGRVVKIGKGCSIDVVEYSEKAEISKKAKVGNLQKTV